MKLFIGMRIFKTAVAVAISVYLGILINLDSPFFAAIAALITLQGNLVDSFSMAKYRLLGTVFGGGFGLMGATLAWSNPLMIGLGIGVIIFLANKLKWNKAIPIASIVYVSIMLVEGSSIYYSLHRVLDTSVGIAVAVIVNMAIYRPYSRDRVMKVSIDLVEKFRRTIKLFLCTKDDLCMTAVEKELAVLEAELPALKKEARMHIYRAEDGIDFEAVKEQFDALYQNLSMLAAMGHGLQLKTEMVQRLEDLYGLELNPGRNLSDKDIVFNYHLEIALDLLCQLKKTFNLPIHEKQTAEG
ncbi:MAG: hypothetical protein FH749_09730 [Firmicutes bacterium]|nr:hypothetical protein [Bacillota bacterium]